MLSREAHELLSETRSAFVKAGPDAWASWAGDSGLCLLQWFIRTEDADGDVRQEVYPHLASTLGIADAESVVVALYEWNDAPGTSWDDVVRLLDAALYESVCEQRAAGRYPAVAPRRWERAR